MALRLAVVLALLALFAIAPALYRRRQRRLERGPDGDRRVPTVFVAGAPRTWLVFTTPWCASCQPVADLLRQCDPEARVVKVDATQERELAGTFAVRSAPTALLADPEGRVQARLVGVQAVDRYVDRER